MKAPPRPLEEPYRSRAAPPGTARYWAWLFAARECRDPLLAVHALLAEWRALMDPATEISVAQAKLAWWREEVLRLMRGAPLHPISRHLAELPRAAATDFAPLLSTIEASSRQVAGAPLEYGAQLEAHADALRGVPLTLAARLAAAPDPTSEVGVRRCLAALAAADYLAAAIGDYRREARIGRVSFPIDELLAAGIEDADLSAAEPAPHVQSYLANVRRRAQALFASAEEALPPAARSAHRHLLVLAALGARELAAAPRAGPLAWRGLFLAWRTARAAAHS